MGLSKKSPFFFRHFHCLGIFLHIELQPADPLFPSFSAVADACWRWERLRSLAKSLFSLFSLAIGNFSLLGSFFCAISSNFSLQYVETAVVGREKLTFGSVALCTGGLLASVNTAFFTVLCRHVGIRRHVGTRRNTSEIHLRL